jgi:cytidylate kinase
MSEDMADLQVWLDRRFKAIDERVRKIEATDKPDEPNMVFDQVSREAVMRFCNAFGIDNDDGLNSLLCDIEAFDGGLEESWDELQRLREKDENIKENLGDVLERVDTASEMLNDLRRDL